MVKTDSFSYIGDELDLFSKAVNWKRYWASRIQPYLGETVLEVGAGIGGTTSVLCHANASYCHWLGLEPDDDMLRTLHQQQANGIYPAYCEFRLGTIESLSADEQFDSVIYIDVLEHIEHDKREVENAAKHVKPGGFLIALSPAHQWLFSEFDAQIGHFRRYNRPMLSALTSAELRVKTSFYLDSVGLLASLGNRLLLRSSMPNEQQIVFWDRVLIRASRIVDPLFGFALGKSVVQVWQRV